MTTTDVESLRAIPDAPTFYPNEAEFKDLYTYLRKIHTEGEAAGICVIVPPPGWRPPFCLPDIKFRTRQQDLSNLHGRVREAKAFERRVRLCHALHGCPLPTNPCIIADTQAPCTISASTLVSTATTSQRAAPINLYSLHRAVADRGGYSTVEDTAQWLNVASELGLDFACQKVADGFLKSGVVQGGDSARVEAVPEWAEAVRAAFQAWLLPVIGPCASSKDPLPLMGTYASRAEEASINGVLLAPQIEALAAEPEPPRNGLPEDKIPLQPGTRFWRYWPSEGRCLTGVILDTSTKGRSYTVEYEEVVEPDMYSCIARSSSSNRNSDSNMADSGSSQRSRQQVSLRSSSRVQPRVPQSSLETVTKTREQFSKWELAVLVANGATPTEAKECHADNICSQCLVAGEPVNHQGKCRRRKVDKALQERHQQRALLVCAGCGDNRHRWCLDSNEIKDLRASTSTQNRNSRPLELVQEMNAVHGQGGAQGSNGNNVNRRATSTAVSIDVNWFCRPCLRAAAKSAVAAHRKATNPTAANTPEDPLNIESESRVAHGPSQASSSSAQKSAKEARLSGKRSSKGATVSADEAVDGGCGNFGFSDGPKHSLTSFRRQAHEWRELYFGKDNNIPSSSLGNCNTSDASFHDFTVSEGRNEAEIGLRAAAAAAHDAAAEGWNQSTCDYVNTHSDTGIGGARSAADRVPADRHLTRSGCLALEAEFWRLVEGRSHRLEQCRQHGSNGHGSAEELSKLTHVVYGSDLDSSLHGSGFPTDRYVSGPAWIPEDLDQDFGAESKMASLSKHRAQSTMAVAAAAASSSTPLVPSSKVPPNSLAPSTRISHTDCSSSDDVSSGAHIEANIDAHVSLNRTRESARKSLFSSINVNDASERLPLSKFSGSFGSSKNASLKRQKFSSGRSTEAGTVTSIAAATTLGATKKVALSQSRKKSMRWACEVCTLLNSACRAKCDACRSSRPREPLARMEESVDEGQERSASLKLSATTTKSDSRITGKTITGGACATASSSVTSPGKGALKKRAGKGACVAATGTPPVAERSAVEYCKSAWNLTNLPTASGSLLRLLGADISGVVVPWLYVGGPFSSFCWHNEDHHMYSVNYHHMGAPKVWYGVAGADAQRFEQRAAEIAPLLCAHAPDLWLRIVTLLSPSALNGSSQDSGNVANKNQDDGAGGVAYNSDGNGNENGAGSTTSGQTKRKLSGVRVVRALHRAGTFVVTFPAAYHAGFNTGFNVAEAVNFATPLWLPWGRQALKSYSNLRRAPVFAHDALVLAIVRALLPDFTPEHSDSTNFTNTRSSRNQIKRRRSNSSTNKSSSESYIGELLQAAADAALEWTANQSMYRAGQSNSSGTHLGPPLALQAALRPAILELQSILQAWQLTAKKAALWAVQCAEGDESTASIAEESFTNSEGDSNGCSNVCVADQAYEEKGQTKSLKGLQVVESMTSLVAAAAASKGISTRANRGSVCVSYECTHTNGGAASGRMTIARSSFTESDTRAAPDAVATKASAATMEGTHTVDTPVLSSVFGRSSGATVSGVACDCCLAYCFVAAVRCRTCAGVGCDVEHLVETCASRFCPEADVRAVGAVRQARDREAGGDSCRSMGHNDLGLGSEVADALGRGPRYDFVSRGPYHEALQLLHALQTQKALAND